MQAVFDFLVFDGDIDLLKPGQRVFIADLGRVAGRDQHDRQQQGGAQGRETGAGTEQGFAVRHQRFPVAKS